jgi:hypothetical protein
VIVQNIQNTANRRIKNNEQAILVEKIKLIKNNYIVYVVSHLN